MQERQPEPTEIDESIEKRIEYLTDTLGLSWDEARRRVGAGGDDTPVSRDESIRLHPSNTNPEVTPKPRRNYESKYDGDTFPVIDTTEKSDRQVITNAVGAAMVRAAICTPNSELTAQERAINRAKEERRGRRW